MPIIINGKSFSGNSITIRNGNVIIDGKIQMSGVEGVVEVRITEGDAVSVTSDASVHCGDV